MKPRHFAPGYLFPILSALLAAHADASYLWATYEPETRTYRMELADLPGKPVTEMSALQLSRIQPYTKSSRKATNGRMRFDAQTLKTAFRARQAEGVLEIGGKRTLVVNHVKASALKTHFADAGMNGFEICAALESDHWRVWTVYQGQKVSTPIFVDGNEAKPINGEVILPLQSSPKGFSIQSAYSLPTAGTFGTDAYEAESHRTTLVLTPTTRVSAGSNPTSYRALEAALEKREAVSPNAPSAKFDFSARFGTRIVIGKIQWAATGVTVLIDETKDDVVNEVESQVRSMFEHRKEQAFWDGDGRHKISGSGSSTESTVQVEDAAKTRYTLKDGIVSSVTRKMADRELSLQTQEVQWLKNGKYLPKEFMRFETDPSGKRTVELTYTDTFAQIGVEHFPASRNVKGTKNGREFTLEILFTPVEPK